MTLLEWLRGPVFVAALSFMILGLAGQLGLTAWGIARAARRAGDRSFPYRAVIVATLRWLLPVGGHLTRRLLFSVTSVVFHVAVILVPLLLAGHIALWERGIGLAWPALPNGVATALTVVAVVTGVALVIQRVAVLEARVLSRFQDYALLVLIAVLFTSGFLVMHPAWHPLSRDAMLLVHVALGDVLLFLIPVTKLNHMALLPASQVVSELAWHFPPDAGSRVAVALGKVNEPI